MTTPRSDTPPNPRRQVLRPDAGRARALRNTMTLPEIILWRHLKNRQLDGFRFHRQHPMLEYVLDFYCRERRLAVEVDGRHHDNPDQAAHDRRRDARLGAEKGILTLRFAAVDILAGDEPSGILQIIAETARTCPPLSR